MAMSPLRELRFLAYSVVEAEYSQHCPADTTICDITGGDASIITHTPRVKERSRGH